MRSGCQRIVSTTKKSIEKNGSNIMINIIINEQNLQVEEGITILKAAEKVGIKIPTLCFHETLSVYGACRLCLVEIVSGGKPGLVASCQYPVKDELVIKTDSDKVHKTRKIILELMLARAPDSEKIKNLAKEYGIIKTRIEKKEKDDCILCGLCVRMCKERMGQTVLGFTGRGFERKVGPAFDKKSPICMGCGACAFICPTNTISAQDFCEKEIEPLMSEFDSDLATKPAINILYPQAIPNAPVIDEEHCVYFNKDKCQICKTLCEADAIDFTMNEKKSQIDVGAVILSPGFELFDAKLKGEYGYGIYPNVITSRQFERILNASGPTRGEIYRPSDEKHPKKLAFISCVGSRDVSCGNEYCSSVCCMYLTKEAIIAREHDPDIEPTIFYIDMRAFGKGFEQYFNNAEATHSIRYIRSMVSRLVELQQSRNLRIRYFKDDYTFTEEEFDLVVLATGIIPSNKVKDLADRFGLDLNEYGFCMKKGFSPTTTSKSGIFVSGTFGEPKDIPETVIEASSAAAEASSLLAPARGTLTTIKEYPEEREMIDEDPRIGVFVCRCGKNIGGYIDVPAVVEHARSLPYVVFADENLYTCAQDSLIKIKSEIEKHELTRVVVASCTPTTHAPLFRDTIREAGLNPYLFEMASLREHVSWVHMNEPEKATQKAKEIVAMAVSKATLLSPIYRESFDLNKEALVIGGGLSGMTAAISLAEQGFRVHLVEKENKLGGHLTELHNTIDGKDTDALLLQTISNVEDNERIKVYIDAELKDISGYLGNYTTQVYLKKIKEIQELVHGVVIIATGAKEIKPDTYLFGQNPNVLTQTEFENRLTRGNVINLNKVVMIQCVGSRDEKNPYCSRICCSHAIKNALKLKSIKPESEITILYRDIRTYGFKEKFYLEARRKGILFVRYDVDDKPQVKEDNGKLYIKFNDPVINQKITFNPDLLILSTGIDCDNSDLARILKLPLTEDGFFMEAHAKIRPLDFTTEGMFLCGLAHSPRTVVESIAQAKGAAIRAVTILSKDKIQAKAEIPTVNEKWCSGCGICEIVCPYDARRVNPDTRIAEVIDVLCQACGACTVACPSNVSQQKGFEKEKIFSMLDVGLEK
jgi:heterodisulfide reductase subunit A